MDFRAFWTKFRSTPYFRLLYLTLVSGLVALILPFGSLCFPLLFIPILMFAVPYWFGVRKMKDHALNGLIVIVLSAALYAIILTPMVVSQEQVPLEGGSADVAQLSDGRVDPFWTTLEDASFNFTVTVTSSSSDAANYTIRLQLFDFEGIQFVPKPTGMIRDASAGDGDFADGEPFYVNTTLPPLVHAYGFQVLTVVNTTQEVVAQTLFTLGPFHAPYTTYLGYFFYQSFIGMVFVGLGFYLVLLVYWWTRKAREIRGVRESAKGPKKRDEGGGEYTCTNCGGDVAEGDETCPNCGASFVSEGEGEVADKA